MPHFISSSPRDARTRVHASFDFHPPAACLQFPVGAKVAWEVSEDAADGFRGRCTIDGEASAWWLSVAQRRAAEGLARLVTRCVAPLGQLGGVRLVLQCGGRRSGRLPGAVQRLLGEWPDSIVDRRFILLCPCRRRLHAHSRPAGPVSRPVCHSHQPSRQRGACCTAADGCARHGCASGVLCTDGRGAGGGCGGTPPRSSGLPSRQKSAEAQKGGRCSRGAGAGGASCSSAPRRRGGGSAQQNAAGSAGGRGAWRHPGSSRPAAAAGAAIREEAKEGEEREEAQKGGAAARGGLWGRQTSWVLRSRHPAGELLLLLFC